MVPRINWDPPGEWEGYETIEMHTGGEPLRIPVGGVPDIPGKTILDKIDYFRVHHDDIRKKLIWEPRGHADMYGAILTEAVNKGSDFGVIFLHNEGYSTMCGHAVIALTKMAYTTGMIGRDKREIIIDGPAGIITSRVHYTGKRITSCSFLNVPSFVLHQDEMVKVQGIGRVRIDIAFGGAFYALCDAGALGLDLDPACYGKLIDYGRRIKKAVNGSFSIRHPYDQRLSFLYGTIFISDPYDLDHHSRNVCVFADGEIDRSATGSGVSARAALMGAKNELAIGDTITIESIIGTTMDVSIESRLDYGGFPAVIPRVSGTSFFTGMNRFFMDPDDDIGEGFFLK